MAAKLHKHPDRRREFPALTHLNHKVTSQISLLYNCVAWALGEDTRDWWPDPMGVKFWPPTILRQETIDAFEQMLKSYGYIKCEKATVEKGLQKVALYVLDGKPTHLAKQLEKGKWSSKLGQAEDIEHTVDALNGPQYGKVHQIYCKKIEKNI